MKVRDTFFPLINIPDFSSYYSNYIACIMLIVESDNILTDWSFRLNSIQSAVSVLNKYLCKVAILVFLHMKDNACFSSSQVTVTKDSLPSY